MFQTIKEFLGIVSYDTCNVNISQEKKTLKKQEEILSKKYGIIDTYLGNDLFYGNLFDCIGNVNLETSINRDASLNTIYNKHMINLIFPNYGTRLCVTKDFSKNIPYINALLDGEWNKTNDVVKNYDIDENGKEIDGSINLIIYTDMQGIIFDKPYKFQTRKIKSQKWFELENIELTNVYDAIIFNNKCRYESRSIGCSLNNNEHDY